MRSGKSLLTLKDRSLLVFLENLNFASIACLSGKRENCTIQAFGEDLVEIRNAFSSVSPGSVGSQFVFLY